MLFPKLTCMCWGRGLAKCLCYVVHSSGYKRFVQSHIASKGSRDTALALATAGELQNHHSNPNPIPKLLIRTMRPTTGPVGASHGPTRAAALSHFTQPPLELNRNSQIQTPQKPGSGAWETGWFIKDCCTSMRTCLSSISTHIKKCGGVHL